ncbi:hypothetical protein ACFXHA_43580 [Nocardia sp. NPDC059240]|uniref:hypothetical protein n=1 Tax=Nocardia sp. NPDC059240 TaxID=3346786 RepID=UPI00368C30A0
MKSLRRQRHPQPATSRQHQLLLQPAPAESAAAERELQTGACACGLMPQTPAWDLAPIEGAFTLHLHYIDAVAELRRTQLAFQERRNQR